MFDFKKNVLTEKIFLSLKYDFYTEKRNFFKEINFFRFLGKNEQKKFLTSKKFFWPEKFF